MNNNLFKLLLLLPAAFIIILFSACNMETDSSDASPVQVGDALYEAQTIQIEGLRELDGAVAQMSIKELRELPQYELDASYSRTTGLSEEFQMIGPLLEDVITFAGGNLRDYAGMGIIGNDGYYCLFSSETIESTPDLMLALVVDGAAELDTESAPARIGAQGQFGPYWVRRVEKIVLYEEIPQKDIKNLWLFETITEGIEPYAYEYYGSQDNSIDLEQVFTRFDSVDSRAFFTMKSADGFTKNEVMSMVKSRYYIKFEGEDAPTNVAPYIKLGMNVQRIAWFSTSADAVVFPNMLLEYMDTKTFGEFEGVPLDELLYEVGFKTVKAASFDLLGTQGERITVSGDELSSAILLSKPGGGAVVWDDGLDYPDIDKLLRIRLSQESESLTRGETDAAE